jgi:hypothetical protein
MTLKILFIGAAAIVISLHTPALSANFTIDNPADRIYNPASDIKNPASNIYNPAAHMDNPSPISPPTQPIPKTTVFKQTTETIPAEQIKEPQQPRPQLTAPHKRYSFKTVRAYMTAAKNAFNRDEYMEFLSITEDALRRIKAGTLRASKKTKQKLAKYKAFGYGLLEKSEEE